MPTGYFDRTQKLHSMADVDRVLAERTTKINQPRSSGKSAPAGEVAGSKPAAAALEWRPQVKGMEAILSACGRYSVSRAAVDGKFCYTAWSRLPLPTPIGEAQYVAELARELCQAHMLGARI